MKRLICALAVFVEVAVAKDPSAQIKEFSLSRDGIGSLDGTVKVQVLGKQTMMSAAVRNNSGSQLRFARFCVQPAGQNVCAFNFWTTTIWVSGQQMDWASTQPIKLMGGIRVSLEAIQVDPFAKVRSVYVETIEGNNGIVARDQIMAAVVNTGRFKLVEDPKRADAVIRGRSEQREKGTLNQSSGSEQSISHSAGIGAGLGSVGVNRRGNGAGVLGVAGGVQRESGKTASESRDWTEVVLTETLLLRLTTSAGESIWAWDDTIACRIPHFKCAIENLHRATIPPTNSAGTQ